VDPSWLIERPTELGMAMIVEQQGPFGMKLPPDAPRPYHEALPLDTVRFTPFVVDRGGPIALDELSVLWTVCPAIACVDALSEADRLPACGESRDPSASCTLGGEPSIALELDPFPEGITEASLFTLATVPDIAFIASRAGDPGAEVCARRLRAREDLGPCVMMLRDIELGSLQDLVDAAESVGIAIEVSESSEELLDVPRNHAPLVQTFEVRGSSRTSGDGNVASGTAVPVALGDDIEIEYKPTEDDYDNFTIEGDNGEQLMFDETLTGQWWLDRPAAEFTPLDLQARWTVSGEPGPAYVYFVVRDGRGSEAWGWLAFEVGAP
jgi:hypothetical protein